MPAGNPVKASSFKSQNTIFKFHLYTATLALAVFKFVIRICTESQAVLTVFFLLIHVLYLKLCSVCFRNELAA